MAPSALDIEQIVRDVMRELELRTAKEVAAPSKPAAPPAATATPAPAPSPASSSKKHEAADSEPKPLVIDASVVTMAVLSGRLDGVRQVVVPAGAVVTPAVYDELYRRNATLTFATTESATGAVRLVLVVAGKHFDPSALVAALRPALTVETHATDCLMAASDLMAAEVARPNTLGVLVTRHTSSALCLANRLSGVRAVWTPDASHVASAAAAVGANVLVLDPRSGGHFGLKRQITEFCRGGVKACPDVFRNRLA